MNIFVFVLLCLRYTYSLVTWPRLVVYSQIFESILVMLLASTVVKVAILVTADSLSIMMFSCASVRLFSSFNRSSITFTISAELSGERSRDKYIGFWLKDVYYIDENPYLLAVTSIFSRSSKSDTVVMHMLMSGGSQTALSVTPFNLLKEMC